MPIRDDSTGAEDRFAAARKTGSQRRGRPVRSGAEDRFAAGHRTEVLR